MLLRRTQIVVATLSIFFFLLYFFEVYRGTFDPVRPVKDIEERFFMPEEWNGLPISTRNHLFVNATKRTREDILSFREDLYNIKNIGWTDGTWKDIIESYLPKIGFNGVMEGIESGWFQL